MGLARLRTERRQDGRLPETPFASAAPGADGSGSAEGSGSGRARRWFGAGPTMGSSTAQGLQLAEDQIHGQADSGPLQHQEGRRVSPSGSANRNPKPPKNKKP